MFYKKITGSGDLNFILIHNAGGNHHFFDHQLTTLQAYGDIIALDLPGHGQSPVANDNTINASSQLIADLCQQLSLTNICLIGLNNGADIVLNTASQHRLKLHSLVLLDPPLFMSESFVKEIESFIDALGGDNYPEFVASLVDALFIQTSESNRKIASDAFLQSDRASLQAMFRSLIEWDKHATQILQGINCPTLCVLSDEHHCQYQALQQHAPQLHLTKVFGSKCWVTLEVPEQINAILKRFMVLTKTSS